MFLKNSFSHCLYEDFKYFSLFSNPDTFFLTKKIGAFARELTEIITTTSIHLLPSAPENSDILPVIIGEISVLLSSVLPLCPTTHLLSLYCPRKSPSVILSVFPTVSLYKSDVTPSMLRTFSWSLFSHQLVVPFYCSFCSKTTWKLTIVISPIYVFPFCQALSLPLHQSWCSPSIKSLLQCWPISSIWIIRLPW